jgi:hypothetical protein
MSEVSELAGKVRWLGSRLVECGELLGVMGDLQAVASAMGVGCVGVEGVGAGSGVVDVPWWETLFKTTVYQAGVNGAGRW